MPTSATERITTEPIATESTVIDLKKKQCLDDYFDNGIPVGDLVRKYQRARGTILEWIVKARRAGRVRTATATQMGPKPINKNEPLSSCHKRFGLHLYHWRMTLPDPTPANAATVLGYSRTAYSKLESGQYDVTLSEMIYMARAIKMELLELLKLKDTACSSTLSTISPPSS